VPVRRGRHDWHRQEPVLLAEQTWPAVSTYLLTLISMDLSVADVDGAGSKIRMAFVLQQLTDGGQHRHVCCHLVVIDRKMKVGVTVDKQ